MAHVTGGALGGAVTGFALGALGSIPAGGSELRLWIVAVAALVALVWDLAAEGKKLGTGRQTPRAWRYLLPPKVVAFLNGFDLGLGWSTRIYFFSYVVAMLAAFATGHALAGAAVGVSFGASRAATVVVLEQWGANAVELIPARRPVELLNAAALTQFFALSVALVLLV